MKLEAFRFDNENAPLDFSRRLARENGWSRAYTVRVIQEYKRFLLMAMHAGHPVTPSDEVDQAWHLHLVYTRSYWEDLCCDTLHRPLHHGPTQGGESEGEKFAEWYEKTRSSYTHLFGSTPPADIWPPTEARFDPSVRFERVDRSRYWLLPRFGLRMPSMAVAIVCLALALMACSKVSSEDKENIVLMGSFALLLVAGIIAWKMYKRGRGGDGCGSFGGGCGGGMSGCGTGHSGGSGHSGCGSHGGGSGCGSSGCGGGGCGGGD